MSYGYSCYWFENWTSYDWQEQLEKRYGTDRTEETIDEPDDDEEIEPVNFAYAD